MGAIGQPCTYESTVKYTGYILKERQIRVEKPTSFFANERRTSLVIYTSSLMCHFNVMVDHLPIITHHTRPRATLSPINSG